MSRSKSDSLLTLTQIFFLNYLQSTRGASSHTVRAYRDALRDRERLVRFCGGT